MPIAHPLPLCVAWLLLLVVIVMSDMTNGGVQGPIEGYNSLDDLLTTTATPGQAALLLPTAPTAAYTHPKWMEPYFDPSTPRNVTALMGKSAYLSCRVRNLANKTVSWIRHRDIHILTVGSYTYTSDQRFQATHHQDTEDWTLQIKWAQKRDAGMYECQISTQPVRSYFVRLNVVVPTATILGGPDLHVDKGSTINLTCTVKFSPEPPAYIFWYHHEEVINYDSSRGGVSVITEKGDVTTSFLLIQNADLADSGKYSCAPSNADVASVRVHVLNVRAIISGEHPEAMQTGSSGCQYNWLTIVLLLGLVLCYSQQCSSAVPASLTSPLPLPSQLPLPAATATATATATGESTSSESVAAATATSTSTITSTRKRCPVVKSCRQTAGHVLAKRSCHR
ncbi:fibroblast growth factor receptor-like 1 isoform X1 [Drosophila eugracilis]|uniref:fibroblast growth factor receptor-like 1 isoform X1 n=1 Tax=Drosophila eugracilis TaxID=29029 RepID=UPI0007E6F650|nr:fibroblast growth factor receptor-like 1 isoform X1 [Drosophila eugracilis]XP_017081119.1 fibroblast growth factor receptor-like 1 isoform X1 [Drosophila eugracilis]